MPSLDPTSIESLALATEMFTLLSISPFGSSYNNLSKTSNQRHPMTFYRIRPVASIEMHGQCNGAHGQKLVWLCKPTPWAALSPWEPWPEVNGEEGKIDGLGRYIDVVDENI